MTTPRRDGGGEPFGQWIRHHPGLDSIRDRVCVTDSDYWIHQYRAHRDCVGARAVDQIMLVEVKCFAKDLDFAQRDTLHLVNQVLRRAAVRPDGRRQFIRVPGNTAGQKRVIRCFGVHVLRLEADRPDTSRHMYWDGRLIDEQRLVEVLRFDRDPDHITKILDLRRHHASKPTQISLWSEPPEAANG